MLQKILMSLVLIMSANAFAAPTDVIAVVGTKQITVKDFNDKFDEVTKQTVAPPTREQFLEDLVRYEVGVQEAQKKNMADDPIVKERFRQEMYKGLIEKELAKRIAEIKVTEDDMKNWYKTNPDIRLSHILIEFRPDATPEQKKAAQARAQEILVEVKKSKRPFDELVGLYTDDVLSKKSGGDVGWQNSLTLVPHLYQTALKMKVGEIHPNLIETQYGFHVVKLTGKRQFDEANKRQLRSAVFDMKRKDIFDDYFASLKKNYTIKVFKDRLAEKK